MLVEESGGLEQEGDGFGHCFASFVSHICFSAEARCSLRQIDAFWIDCFTTLSTHMTSRLHRLISSLSA